MVNQLGLIGTNKGLVVYSFSEFKPLIHSFHFLGFAVTMVYVDERIDRWWVGLSHKHWGQKLHYSDDRGETWHEKSLPSFDGIKLPNGSPANLRQLWCMTHAGYDRPGAIWLGTDPGGLFRSADNGSSFKLVKGLWDHPSHQKEKQWSGAGSDCPFIHSIVVDPDDSDHLYIAVSCAGIFESNDGGISWNPKNNGLRAAYLPNPKVEVGHDPHLLLMSKKNSKILWQQNHCGIFNSLNGGEDWKDVTAKDTLPDYGFCLAIDDNDPAKAWVIPVDSDNQRIAPGLALQVYRTIDFGQTWQIDSEGLPTGNAFDIVLRHSFSIQNNLFLFGTTNGNLYYRHGPSEKWSVLSNNLTKVNTIFVYTLSD